jgi:hypothetical protein
MLTTFRRLGLCVLVTLVPAVSTAADQKRAESHPILAYNFLLEVDGVNAGYFKGVDGLQAQVEVVQHQEGDLVFLRRLATAKLGDIVLERGYTANDDLFKWWKTKRGLARTVKLSLVQYPTRNGKHFPKATARRLCSFTLHEAKLTALQSNEKDGRKETAAKLISRELTHTCQSIILEPGEKPKRRASK